MGDGSLSQEEIDRVLTEGDDLLADMSGNNDGQDTDGEGGMIKSFFAGLFIKDNIKAWGFPEHLDVRMVVSGIMPAVPSVLRAMSGRKTVLSQILAFPGDAAFTIDTGTAWAITHLMMGDDEPDSETMPSELPEAEKSILDYFFTEFWKSFLKALGADGEELGKEHRDMFAADRDECLSAGRWKTAVTCGIVVDNTRNGLECIRSAFSIILDEEARAAIGRILRQSTTSDREGPSETLRAKIGKLARDKGDTSLKKQELLGFYKNVLSTEERMALMGGDYREKTDRSMNKMIVERLTQELREAPDSGDAALTFGAPEYLESYLDDMRFPVALRFGDAVMSAADCANAARPLPGLRDYVGKTGSLVIGGRQIATVLLAEDKKNGMALEVVESRLPGDKKLLDGRLLDTPFRLTAEVARKSIRISDAASIRNGSIIEFDRLAGEPADLVVEEFDTPIARAEVVAIDEHFGLRVTDMLPVSIAKASAMRPDDRPDRIHETPMLTLRCVLGSTVLGLSDVLGIGEGSIIELDRLAGEAVDVIIGRDIHLKAEIIVIDDYFGVRIVEPRGDDTLIEPGKEEEEPAGTRGVTSLPEAAPSGAIDSLKDEMARLRMDIDEIRGAAASRAEDRPIGGNAAMSGEETERRVREIIHEAPETAAAAIIDLSKDRSAKAGALMIGLGKEDASAIMRALPESWMETFTFEMMRRDLVGNAEIRASMRDFLDACDVRMNSVPGGIDFAREVLEGAVGGGIANGIISRITDALDARPFDSIRRSDPAHLLNFIQCEHPQTIAFVLSLLDPQKAAFILAGLSHQIQADVARRIACLDRVAPGVLHELERMLERKFESASNEEYVNSGGLDAVVEILHNADIVTGKIITEALGEEDGEMAEEIARRMRSIGEVLALDGGSLKQVLDSVDPDVLAIAMLGFSDENLDRIYGCMTVEQADRLKERTASLATVDLNAVEMACRRIVDAALELEMNGEIVF